MKILHTLLVAVVCLGPAFAQTASPEKALVQRYCFGCHNNTVKTAGVTLQGLRPGGRRI